MKKKLFHFGTDVPYFFSLVDVCPAVDLPGLVDLSMDDKVMICRDFARQKVVGVLAKLKETCGFNDDQMERLDFRFCRVRYFYDKSVDFVDDEVRFKDIDLFLAGVCDAFHVDLKDVDYDVLGLHCGFDYEPHIEFELMFFFRDASVPT